MKFLELNEVEVVNQYDKHPEVRLKGAVLIPVSSIVAVEDPTDYPYAGRGWSFVYVGWRRYLVDTPFTELTQTLNE